MEYGEFDMIDRTYGICVDKFANQNFMGRIYFFYEQKYSSFTNIVEMLQILENTMNIIQYPENTTEKRSFATKTVKKKKCVREGKENTMKQEKVEQGLGKQATFVVEMQYREYSTWQGKIRWVDGNKEVYFRSALEMLHLMESICGEKIGLKSF